jgi:hypothetical protein
VLLAPASSVITASLAFGTLASSDASISEGGTKSAPPSYGFFVTYITMGVVLFALMIVIIKGLRNWSLGDALTEDMGNGVFKPSISRLIALLGFAVIICIYLGTGCSVIYRILSGGDITDLSGLGTFLVSAAALFTPYLANQIKSAVIGVVNGPSQSSPGAAPMVTAFSPMVVSSGVPQQITVTGSNLTQIQSAICTLQNGSEAPISSSSVNVLNGGAVEVTVTMPPPQPAQTPYQSTLSLLTNTSQRISCGSYTVN